MNLSRLKIWVGASLLTIASTLSAHAQGTGFNAPGNILIADQFNNRVIEVDLQGNIVWNFGLGPADFSPASIIGTNDAQRVGKLTLMAGTGTPGGQPEAPNCTNPSGCPNVSTFSITAQATNPSRIVPRTPRRSISKGRIASETQATLNAAKAMIEAAYHAG